MSTRRLDACCSRSNQKDAAKPIRIDTRSQGVPQLEANQQEYRQKLISKLVRAVLSHPDTDNLSQELQESCHNEFTTVSEKAKKKIHSQGNTEGFELCALSERLQCVHCLRSSALESCIVGVVHFFHERTCRLRSVEKKFRAQSAAVRQVDDPSMRSHC